MNKRKFKHLPTAEVYKDYGLAPGTELVYLNLPEKFKIRPALVEVEGEYVHFVLVRVYFGEESEICRERSYVTTIDKFSLYHEFNNGNLYIGKGLKEGLYV